MLSARPLLVRVLAKLIGQRGLRADGAAVELAPASTTETGRAYYLPGEPDRIRGFAPGAPPAEQLGWLHPGPVRHLATRGWEVRNALLSANAIYAGRGCDRHGRGEWLLRGPAEEMAEAQFCGGQGGATWFGHWLYEELSTEILARDRGLPPVALRSTTYPHEAGYRALTGLHALKPALARIDRLWLIDDRGHNQAHVARCRRLRDLVRGGVAPTGDRLVYLGRGSSGASRTLVNEVAVKDALAARGFAIVEPEHLAPREVAAALAGARLVVSVEGSALCHGLVALPTGAALLAIMPPRRFNGIVKVVSELVGLRFGLVVAEEAGTGFVQDVDRLLRTVDLLPDL